jgi:hypothetical protein
MPRLKQQTDYKAARYPCKLTSRGIAMTRPTGYRQAAKESCFCLLALCLPYYQSLLIAGLSGMISVLLLTAVLILFVARTPQISRTIAALAAAFPQGWLTPQQQRGFRRIALSVFITAQGPSLAPGFQRPPPLFS